jgi:hypothetical protein
MGQLYGEEFKQEAVRLALTSGLPRKQNSIGAVAQCTEPTGSVVCNSLIA